VNRREVLLGLCAAGLAVRVEAEDAPAVPPGAKKIGRAPGTLEGDHFWSAEHEILVLERSSSNKKAFKLRTVDARTRESKDLSAFNKKLADDLVGDRVDLALEGIPGGITYDPPSCSISPDGRWLLWLSGNRKWVTASLDGKEVYSWPKAEGVDSGMHWLTGETWLETRVVEKADRLELGQMVVRRIGSPMPVSQTTLTGVEDATWFGISESRLLGRVGADELSKQETILVLPLSGAPKLERYTVPLPKPAIVSEVSLSREGNRLVWLLQMSEESDGEYQLHLSGLRGEGMRELGRMRGQTARTSKSRTGEAIYWPQQLRWAPGGKQLSFIFKDELCVLAVGDAPAR